MGADDLLVKPVSREKLVQAVQYPSREIQKILIADDDPDIVALFRRILAPLLANAWFIEAYHGQEALDLALEHQPDMILIDVKMPELDGYSVIRQLKAAGMTHRPYIILISGEAGSHLTGEIRGEVIISRGSGYPFAELLHSLDMIIRILSPGWFEG